MNQMHHSTHSPESYADIAGLFDAALCAAEAAWDGIAFVDPFAVDERADGLEDVRYEERDKEGHDTRVGELGTEPAHHLSTDNQH